jgi:large subunit ribosomal protein L25
MASIMKLETRKKIGEKKYEKTDLRLTIPGVVYGPSSKNNNFNVTRLEFEKIYAQAGESNLIETNLDNGDVFKTLVKDIQRNPISNSIIHIDLYQVDMNKKITTEIPLEFIGESKAVKDLGMVLVKSIDSLEVECLPGNLVDHFTVDISSLNTADDVIKVGDLKLPNGIELLSNNSEDIIANVIDLEVEPVEAPVAPAVEAAEPAKEPENQDKKE